MESAAVMPEPVPEQQQQQQQQQPAYVRDFVPLTNGGNTVKKIHILPKVFKPVWFGLFVIAGLVAYADRGTIDHENDEVDLDGALFWLTFIVAGVVKAIGVCLFCPMKSKNARTFTAVADFIISILYIWMLIAVMDELTVFVFPVVVEIAMLVLMLILFFLHSRWTLEAESETQALPNSNV
jgi:hypothetical protein